ncbi:class I adenylate-forming enzyme family protein [Saccharopolyspora pogona]|uniref:class I adenylate-forming enzyme family protein n=1 Tax=Saccharopolyspora pogona TaxID=333966 RepID=UPI001689D937|nr:class I adenylate-forming enzyme family protein [Saccharopolyspora pogona]
MSGPWADGVRRWAGTGRRALTTGDAPPLTYRRWVDEGDALARALIGAGLAPGARVATLLPNGTELLTALYACARVGVTAVPVSTWATGPELRRVLDAARPDLLLTADTVPGAPRELPIGTYSWGETTGPALPLADLLELGGRVGDGAWLAAVDAPDVGSDFVVLYTSGSTGAPKGVVLSQGAVARNAALIADRMGFADGERVYTYFPLFFSGGLCNALSTTVAVGAELVTQARFTPAGAAALIHERRCTARDVWHDGLARVAAEHAFTDEDLRRMRRGLVVDSALLAAHGAADDLGVDMYGMTETATAFTCGHHRDPAAVRQTTQGRPLPGNLLRIVDPDTGRELKAGEQGEILVRGLNTMSGYTDGTHLALIDEDGFFHTGDVGSLSPDGHVRYAGRTKTMIKVKGLTVQPEEVEAVLTAFPGVRLAVVTGLGAGHESSGIGAIVVLDPGTAPAEVAAWCRHALSSYKVPELRSVAEADFPLSASLKNDRLAAWALFPTLPAVP